MMVPEAEPWRREFVLEWPHELYLRFDAQTVRDRVAANGEWLRATHCGDEIEELRNLHVEGRSSWSWDWYWTTQSTRWPLNLEDIVEFSRTVGISFGPVAVAEPRTSAWHRTAYQAEVLRAAASALQSPILARMEAEVQTAMQKAYIDARASASMFEFDGLLPQPPKAGTKYAALFAYLDCIETPGDEPFEIDIEEIERVLGGVSSERRPGEVGLPAMARLSPRKFWGNLVPWTAEERIAQRRSTQVDPPARAAVQPRAWRATGLSVAWRKVDRDGSTSISLTFTPAPGRHAWWQRRGEIRRGELDAFAPTLNPRVDSGPRARE